MNEFDLIDVFFKQPALTRPDVLLGIGDDAALLIPPKDQQIAASMDTLVDGVHFLASTPAEYIGHKALAVNLSDLAAMGAEPAWVMLALTLPNANEKWLHDFAKGFYALANLYQLTLIGGDTTHGPLSITIQIQGFVPAGLALRRDGAKPGDKIYVSGTLGDAGAALAAAKYQTILSASEQQYVMQRLHLPTPRVALGLALRSVASSAIDVSDGLLADLRHIVTNSRAGAEIHTHQIPLSSALQKLPRTTALEYALSAGDDYELCFTVPSEKSDQIKIISEKVGVPCTCIGEITNSSDIQVSGETLNLTRQGYQHF